MMLVKYFVRAFFVVLWSAIIYSFLLLPYLEPWFFHDTKYLCIYTWADRVDESKLQEFERKTGIKVYVNHYESNEELLTKLEKMPFVDCDIILPSGYIVESLAQSGLIKKIDRSRCNFISRLYPEFINTTFKMRDEYALPLYWDVLGIGFNNKKIDSSLTTLQTIFDNDSLVKYKIGMIDDARQSIVLTALYLGYSLDTLSKEQLKDMRVILNKQKEWVGAYSDSQQGYYLASQTFDMVVSEREHICRQMQNHDFISFALPEQGSLLTVDHVVISSFSTKDDLIYELINYLYSYDVCKYHCERFCLLPTRKDVRDSLDQKYVGVQGLIPGSDKFKKLKVFKNILTSKQINDFWIKLKAI